MFRIVCFTLLYLCLVCIYNFTNLSWPCSNTLKLPTLHLIQALTMAHNQETGFCEYRQRQTIHENKGGGNILGPPNILCSREKTNQIHETNSSNNDILPWSSIQFIYPEKTTIFSWFVQVNSNTDFKLLFTGRVQVVYINP